MSRTFHRPKNRRLQVFRNYLAMITNFPVHPLWKFNWIKPKSSHITIQSILIRIQSITTLEFQFSIIFSLKPNKISFPQNFFFRTKTLKNGGKNYLLTFVLAFQTNPIYHDVRYRYILHSHSFSVLVINCDLF